MVLFIFTELLIARCLYCSLQSTWRAGHGSFD